jgi:hypothetical protein
MNEAAAFGLGLAGVIALISFTCAILELLKDAQRAGRLGLTRLLGLLKAKARDHRRGQVLRGNAEIGQPQPEV